MLFNENNNNNLNRILCNTIMINYKMPRNISIKCFFNIVILLTIFVSVVHACGPGRGIGGPRKNRKLTPLVFKQHVPNMSENTLGASGLQEGKIKRDHPKFRDLVPNYNKDIIFKDEEGTGADRLMTQRCKERLNTLAVSVMNQWPGVRLRVTESWDEDNLHGPDSLHYEGRAVDITTSDRDRSKYGMLARLAVEAGFDWVYYESRAHIHCSVKSDSKQLHHTSGCFTANSTVYTSTGEKRRLSDLKIGEKVLSISPDGKAVFSDVISFLDRHSELNRKFVRIKTDGGATITSTPEHLIMIWKPNEKYQFIFADQIEEGDYLLVNKNNTFVPRKVIRITVINSKGVYAPLTREGTIIIDSIAASCYALVNSQSLAHWSFMPLRIMNSIWDYWFQNTSVHSTEQIGIHWYAQLLYSFRNYLVPNDLIYQ